MKVLISGITGFAGSYLAEYLFANNQVYGIARWRSKMDNIEGILPYINIVNADIKDSHSIFNVFQEVKPDYCFHLAAQSFVKESWNSPAETMNTNVIGTVNILEAVRRFSPDCKVVVAGSSEEYGLVKPTETPIKESNPLRPMSPYGVSKVATDKLGLMYHASYGLDVVVTRAFNHTGPRRGEVFVTSNFAKQIAMIEAKKQEPVLRVGNLDAQRDWTDVRDMVRAYWLAMIKCKAGEVYNICSGRATTVSDMLEMLLNISGMDLRVEHDQSRMRPSDVPILLGNNNKFRKATGWNPEIELSVTLEHLLNYWRERV